MSLRANDSRFWQATAAIGLVLPSLGLVGVRFLSSHAAPASARAESPDSGFVLNGIVNRPITPEQRQLAKAMVAADKVKFGSSPFRAPAILVDPNLLQPGLPAGLEEGLQPGKLFALTSILGTAERPLAVINGKVHQPDAELQDGWRLGAIDPVGGTAQIVNDKGERAVLYLPRPKIGRVPDQDPSGAPR